MSARVVIMMPIIEASRQGRPLKRAASQQPPNLPTKAVNSTSPHMNHSPAPPMVPISVRRPVYVKKIGRKNTVTEIAQALLHGLSELMLIVEQGAKEKRSKDGKNSDHVGNDSGKQDHDQQNGKPAERHLVLMLSHLPRRPFFLSRGRTPHTMHKAKTTTSTIITPSLTGFSVLRAIGSHQCKEYPPRGIIGRRRRDRE